MILRACFSVSLARPASSSFWANFSAFFGKVQLRGVPDGVFGDQEVFYDPNAQTINQSVTGKQKGLPAKPAFLAEAPIPPEQQQNQDLSLLLAQWMTNPQNRFFARASVNRLWSQFFGRGIVHPVDDFGPHNPASQPRLLCFRSPRERTHRWVP